MFTMAQIHDIRKMYFEEGQNISQIARETGHDRKTIRGYLEQADFNRPIPVPTQTEPFPKLAPYQEQIDRWLMEDKQAKRKQRHTAKRVYDRLRTEEEGFSCSYRTVAAYVAMKRKKLYREQKSALPLLHTPGEAQADFGEAAFYENGHHYVGNYLTVSFPYSNQGYTQLFYGQNTECLLEGLARIFEYIGGVPRRIWFDNASSMVKKVLRGGARELTETFLRFTEHYGIEAAFCNPNAGHEKGHVENKVGYLRRNLFVPVPEMDSLAAYNEALLKRCEEDGQRSHYQKEEFIERLFEEDRAALGALPTIPLDLSSYLSVRTDAYGKFHLNQGLHTYSTAPSKANCVLLVKLTADRVIPLDENLREIVTHKRLYGGTKEESMEWIPYLKLLSQRPAALKYSGIYTLLPAPMQEYLEQCDYGQRKQILQTLSNLSEESGFAAAADTVQVALCYEAMDVESLTSLHRRLHQNVPELPPLRYKEGLPQLTVAAVDLSTYDKGIVEGGAPLC